MIKKTGHQEEELDESPALGCKKSVQDLESKKMIMSIKKWIPDGAIGLVVTALFLFMPHTGIFELADSIEMKTFDFRARIASPGERNPDIELVVITEEDFRELGRFPWPRHILARGIHNLSLAGARVIALDIPLTEPEKSAGLRAVRHLKETYETQGLAQEGSGLSFYKMLSETAVDLDNDAKLYKAIKEAGNVVLPVYFNPDATGIDRKAPEFVLQHSLKRIEGPGDDGAVSSMVWLSKVEPIFPNFAEVASSIGHINLFQDNDGYVRSQIHVLGYLQDIYFPSFPIAVVSVFRGLEDEDMTFFPGLGVRLGENPSSALHVPTLDPRMRTLIHWHKGPGIAFHQTPFLKIYKNDIQTSLFRDKIVILGLTARGTESRLRTPLSEDMPGIEIFANSVANILYQRFYARPEWGHSLEFGVLLLFGFYISFVLPSLRIGMGTLATLSLLVIYGGLGIFLFSSHNIWIKIASPILLLILGYLLIVLRRFLFARKTGKKMGTDTIEFNKIHGLSFQQQGMLDLALEKFQQLPPEEEGVKDLLYNLGLDFERNRQFSKALSTYGLINEDGTNFRDLSKRIQRLRGEDATMVFGTGGDHPDDTGPSLKGKTLGRYAVIGEMGRGAMGIVYKGLDTKINRTVAIKTLRLTNFDGDALGETKARFFREAESAGLLTHPNIVTIYDCGEEHDLAYIAMEYMDGDDLDDYTKKDRLLPLRECLSIVSQVADALDYAHDRGIVHRDIKPANIMRIEASMEVKVTDFGIARLTSSSRTKTGLVLGTPSYMSPEQIAGKKVDGRSDIFSLGVVLFEMLTGQKPFNGEDMTSLMYHIAGENHPSARRINPKIPPVVEKIIDKALEKDPEKRYQKAGQMGRHLKKVVARIDEIASRKKGESRAKK